VTHTDRVTKHTVLPQNTPSPEGSDI
jgi:hypothetical protein